MFPTPSTKNLGVLIETNLKFKVHIYDIVSRAKHWSAFLFNCFITHNPTRLIIIIVILVLHLRLSSKLPQRRMRLCSVLEKFSFKQFFKHRISYVRVFKLGGRQFQAVGPAWKNPRGSIVSVEVAGTNRSLDAADLCAQELGLGSGPCLSRENAGGFAVDADGRNKFV